MVIDYDADDLIYLPEIPDAAYSVRASLYYSEDVIIAPEASSVKWTSSDEDIF